MSPFLKLVLLVALLAAAWWLVTTYRASRGSSAGVRFTPVEELAPEVRTTIDAALSRGELVPAIQHYRAATGAGLAAAKAAVETRRWTVDGGTR